MGRDSEKRFHISPQQIIASTPYSYSGVFMASAREVFANGSGTGQIVLRPQSVNGDPSHQESFRASVSGDS